MNTLGNPYHDKPDPDITRKVVANVGLDDWNHFNRALPFRGNQDQLISTLFNLFITQLKLEGIPPHYDTDNHSRIESILGRLTFLPISGGGHRGTNGRPEAGVPQDPTGEASLSSETESRSFEDLEETFWKENWD